jgi:RimJ/RimL family protein N-acetyltransferase
VETYPKQLGLQDGTKLDLVVMTEDDMDDLVEFFQSLPPEDRLYLRSDISDPENVRRRFGELDYDRMFPLLARYRGRIVGIATIWRASFGWMRNLGEIRIVIARDFQRRGLATIFTRELFFQALKQKIYKLQGELMDTQESAIAAFERLGFRKEAVLRKHVTDIKGIRRDLVIMSLDAEDLWYLIEDRIQTPEFRMH